MKFGMGGEAFLEVLKSSYDEHSFPPQSIYNCDESGLKAVCQHDKKVLTVKGSKWTHKPTHTEKGA